MSKELERKTAYELFGTECNEGWKHLYLPLIKLCEVYGWTVLQVKEKFGGLRFYASGPTDIIDLQPLIDAVEAKSYTTCEDCGVSKIIEWKDGKVIYLVTTSFSETSGWLRSLCPDCRKKFDDGRRKDIKEPAKNS